MAAIIRPTLLLKMSLAEEVYSDDVAAEIKRSYSYVSPVLIESHKTEEGNPENSIRCVVNIRKPYWKSSEEGANELWADVMVKWFSNIFEKISSTMDSYNQVRLESNEPALYFSWLEIAVEGNTTIAIRLKEGAAIPSPAVDCIEKVRVLANTQALQEKSIMQVRIPSRESEKACFQVDSAAAEASSAGEEEELSSTDDMLKEEDPQSLSSCYSKADVTYADGTTAEVDLAVIA